MTVIQAALVLSTFLPLVFGRDGAVYAISGHGQRMLIDHDYAVIECANGATPTVIVEQNIVIVKCFQ